MIKYCLLMTKERITQNIYHKNQWAVGFWVCLLQLVHFMKLWAAYILV